MHTRYPLAIRPTAPPEIIERYDLFVEASPKLPAETPPGMAERVRSAHAPYSHERVRLNIASTDEAFRQHSLAILAGYIDACRRFPRLDTINLHAAPKRWYGKDGELAQEGRWELLIEGLRRLADLAGELGFRLVVENTRQYWHHEFLRAPGTPEGISDNEYFGTEPEEWLRIVREVDRPNVRNCLDTSHACTYLLRYPVEERLQRLDAFVAEPAAIGHVHWNDNYLFDPRGRRDQHRPVGDGTLPLDLHRRIAALEATLVLEHYYSEDELRRELDFIRSL